MRSFATFLMGCLFLVPGVVGSEGLESAEVPKRPNIVFILADDVSPEMFSCYNPESPARTPHPAHRRARRAGHRFPHLLFRRFLRAFKGPSHDGRLR